MKVRNFGSEEFQRSARMSLIPAKKVKLPKAPPKVVGPVLAPLPRSVPSTASSSSESRGSVSDEHSVEAKMFADIGNVDPPVCFPHLASLLQGYSGSQRRM